MRTARIGTMLYGHCNGFFRYLDFDPRRIEAIGADWIVARNSTGRPDFCVFERPGEMDAYLEAWLQEREEEQGD